MKKSIILAGRMKNGKDTVAEQLAKEHGYVIVGFADELKRTTASLFNLDDAVFWGSSDERNKPFETPIDVLRIEQAARAILGIRSWGVVSNLFKDRVTALDVAEALRAALLPRAPITSARVLLQLMGTEFGRAIWEDVWVHAVERTRQSVGMGYVYFRRDGVQSQLRTRLAPAPIVVPDARHKNETRYGFETLASPVFWIDAERRVPRDPRFDHSSEPSRADLEPYITDSIDNNGTLDELTENVRRAVALHLSA